MACGSAASCGEDRGAATWLWRLFSSGQPGAPPASLLASGNSSSGAMKHSIKLKDHAKGSRKKIGSCEYSYCGLSGTSQLVSSQLVQHALPLVKGMLCL